MPPRSDDIPSTVPDEEILRAQIYGMLAGLLSRTPDAGMLTALSSMEGDERPLGRAFMALAEAARATNPAVAQREYDALFIGVGGGELTPFASYYRTGFLHEKPLADLRSDMARLGIARADTVKEPEDHIAALFEMMAGLITGAFGDPVGLDEQHAFHDRHIASWAPRFFADLEKSPSASLYQSVGALGRLFLDIENQAFALAL